jgi:hypothetical protein
MKLRTRYLVGLWVVALVGAGVLLAIMGQIDPHPHGIVGLELAFTKAKAAEILGSWTPQQVADAKRSVRLDYLFIIAYVIVVSSMCVWGPKRLGPRANKLGKTLAVMAVVAGLFDVIEDFALRKMLSGSVVRPWPALASGSAVVKFSLLGMALLWGIVTSMDRITWAAEEFLGRNPGDTPIPSVVRSQAYVVQLPHSSRDRGQARRWYRRVFLQWFLGLPTRLPLPPAPNAPEPKAPPKDAKEEERETTVGVCCSGGGIRSAAYNLGALQVLQEKGVLRKARYLAAVSGGSYMAASYALVTARSDPSLLTSGVPAYAPGSPEEHFLRNRSSYLAPPGVAGKAWLALRALLGVAVNLGFIALFLYIIGRPLGWWFGRFLHPALSSGGSPEIKAWMWRVTAIPAGVGVALALGDLLGRPVDRARRFLRAWSIRLIVLGIALLVVLIGLPFAVELMRDLKVPGLSGGKVNPLTTLPLAGVGTMLLGAIQSFLAKRRAIFAMLVGAVIGPLLVLATFVLFVKDATLAGSTPSEVLVWLGVYGIFLVFYSFSDLTSWSPHPFYKRALWGSFGVRRRVRGDAPVAEAIPFDPGVKVSEVPRVPDTWPELIVCAAVNTSDEAATPPGRNAASFTFTPELIGSPVAQYVPTAEYESSLGARSSDVSLIGAVAISGAALSPSMGKMTRAPIRFLIGLLNLRLGVWVPNPLWTEWWKELGHKNWLERFVRSRPRPRFLLRELLGRNHLDSKFLYVTDGGHYENLGLVELLRRGCTEIYCFDAAGDDLDTFYTLGQAVALARMELDVQVDIRPDAMKLPAGAEYSPTDFVVGAVNYRNGTQGLIVFAKAAVTQDAPWDVRAFRQKDKRFPTHGTIDQFFNEEKFEAYRALGAHTARRALTFMEVPMKASPPPIPSEDGKAAAAAPTAGPPAHEEVMTLP